jgi:hypothetical protein
LTDHQVDGDQLLAELDQRFGPSWREGAQVEYERSRAGIVVRARKGGIEHAFFRDGDALVRALKEADGSNSTGSTATRPS